MIDVTEALDKIKGKDFRHLKPLWDSVLVIRLEVEQEHKSSGGLVLVGSGEPPKKEHPALVIAVGQGYMSDGNLLPLSVSVGDLIHLAPFVGETFQDNGIEITMIKESSILAIADNIMEG